MFLEISGLIIIFSLDHSAEMTVIGYVYKRDNMIQRPGVFLNKG